MEPAEVGPELPPHLNSDEEEDKEDILEESKHKLQKKVTGFVDDKTESDLYQRNQKKGKNSYYYAHNYDKTDFHNEKAKNIYGDGIIHGGAPQLLERKESVVKIEEVKKVAAIKKYAWNDEEKKVKVLISLDQFPTSIG